MVCSTVLYKQGRAKAWPQDTQKTANEVVSCLPCLVSFPIFSLVGYGSGSCSRFYLRYGPAAMV